MKENQLKRMWEQQKAVNVVYADRKDIVDLNVRANLNFKFSCHEINIKSCLTYLFMFQNVYNEVQYTKSCWFSGRSIAFLFYCFFTVC